MASRTQQQQYLAPLAGDDPDRSPAGRAWLGAVLIVAAALGLLYPLWTRHEIVYSKHSDIVAEHLSVKAVGRRAILDEGCFPLWNPSMNGGAPAFANPQSMYVFPFDLLYLVLPLDVATNLVILLNVVLAGLAMFLLSRRVFKRWAAALFCALAYMLSYRYLAMIHAGWLPKMSMYALTPLLFWACARLLERPNGPRAAVLAVVVALGLLQGDMQQFYYSGIGCLFYVLARLARVTPPLRVRTCLSLIAGGVLGVMLAAPALLPRLEFAALSTRTTADYRFFLTNPPTSSDLTTALDPDDHGGQRNEFWENNFYFGLWLLPLWAAAFLGNRRRTILLLAAAGVMIVLCFDTFLLRLLYDHLPGFALFRQSSRLLLLAQFVLVLVAGLGVDVLAARGGRDQRVVFLPAVLATLAIALIAAAKWDAGPPLAACVLLVAAGLPVAIPRSPRVVTVVAFCLLPVLDAAFRTRGLVTTAPLAEAFSAHAMHELLRRDTNPGRVLATSRTAIPYGMAGYFAIDLVNGYASLNLKHYVEYLAILQHGTRTAIPPYPVLWTDCGRVSKPELLRALDVRYIVGNWSYPFDRIGYQRSADYRQVPVFVFYEGMKRLPVKTWRLEDPLGPAYFAEHIEPVSSEDESLQALTASQSALTAYVMGLHSIRSDLDYAGGSPTLTRRGLNRYEYELDSRGTNFLILSQVWYPGWQATLNGREVELYRTNHALLGCFIPPGQHHLVLEMTSPPLRRGLVVAGLAAAALLVLLLADLRRRTPHTPILRPAATQR